jgi:D-xylose transport system substrate-binding protein
MKTMDCGYNVNKEESVRTHVRSAIAAAAVLVAAAIVAVGCGGGGGGGGPKIGLLLPQNDTPRYEAADRPFFEAKVKKLCPDCQVIYQNAAGNVNDQQSQAESVLTQGVKVLVLDPVDATSAAAIVDKAHAQNVPVISYDRLVLSTPNLTDYVSFDSVKVGRLQGSSLATALKKAGKPSGPIVQLNGDPADHNAKLFAQGAEQAFKAAGIQVAKKYDTPGWTASNAQNEMQQAITALGNTGFAGVYGANDDLAGGAIAAMKSAGINSADRPSTGQDATDAGIQRILAGQQYMTVYKPILPLANAAAELAVPLAQGKSIPSGLINGKFNNLTTNVPTVVFNPIAVTKSNVKSTVIADGFTKPANICTGPYVSACKAAGITP